MKHPHASKTNAVRQLDAKNIPYTLREYLVDESDLSAIHVAEAIAMPIEQVFKTLVVRGDKTGVLLACIPGACELDLKTLAHVSGNKRIELVPLKEVQELTGYVRGGVSPVGTRKPYPVFLDEAALQWPAICVSAGKRGYQMELDPRALLNLLHAHVYRIAS